MLQEATNPVRQGGPTVRPSPRRTMLTLLTASLALVSTTTAVAAAPARGPDYLNPDKPVAVRVNDLLSRMSLDDKLGQMTQAERLAITDPADIATYRLGSLLSGGGSTPTPNTPTAWAD